MYNVFSPGLDFSAHSHALRVGDRVVWYSYLHRLVRYGELFSLPLYKKELQVFLYLFYAGAQGVPLSVLVEEFQLKSNNTAHVYVCVLRRKLRVCGLDVVQNAWATVSYNIQPLKVEPA